MVSVSLIWIYMIITCYITGYTVLWLLSEKLGYHVEKESSYLYAGIVAVTVYAQFFSIFHKVSLSANLILLVISIICVFVLRKEFLEHLHTLRLTITPVKAGVILFLFLLFAYGAATGIIHYDTGLYHAQSIRWIEEYGIVPGLGNLHSRLAYNSSSFCLSALYSFSFLGGQSYHCCAGFMAFLLALTCVEGFFERKVKRPQLSDFVRIMGIYYLMIIFDEMVSPASDYFMVLGVFYLVIRWLDLMEKGEKSYVPYALLSVMGVWIVSLKLSGALILLLTIKPAVQMIREKKGKQIALFLGTGIFTLLPFLVRNVILSGWLLYPFTFIDLFQFSFKIPKGMADYDSKEIQVWGRGFSDVTRYGEPVTDWLPGWAASLDGVNKVFLLLAFAGIFLFLAFFIYALWKKKRDMTDTLFVMGTMGMSFLFWLFSAPLIRYGCIYLWVFPVLVWGYLYLKISPSLDRYRIFFILIGVAGIYKLGAFGLETTQNATAEYLIHQKDYENFETIAYELHGYTFYYPAEGDRTGYRDFPSSPVKAEDIFIGDTIEEGFKDVIHSNS
ncbi:MAG: LIC_10190 family membrane protein [Suilimivivens sp.]